MFFFIGYSNFYFSSPINITPLPEEQVKELPEPVFVELVPPCWEQALFNCP
jgi:hypothetical protein